ncbi:alpha/beta hydrolase [Actinomadura gamaensis]|uniref:Alpha/beta hydrolase n=1 Tax=Actinomadura gamaensis TaxID=1763541 RepID=A0ABV9U4G0_9ACTN
MRGFGVAGVVAAVALAVGGCGSSGGGAEPAGTPSKVHSTVRPACLMNEPNATFTWAGDSQVLMLGSGTKGVLLAPQVDGSACSWINEMHRLAQAGYRVAAVSYEDDRSRSLPAALKALRDAGAAKVVLMGASAGGGLVLDQAGGLRPAPDGVIAVSPVEVWKQPPGPEGYRGPVLVLESKSDNSAPLADVQALAARHPGGAQTLLFDGNDHGYSLVLIQDRARKAIDAFLKKWLG